MSERFENVRGFSDLDRLMQELPPKIERNVLRGGLRAGAVVFRDEVRANAPRATGKYVESIKVSTNARDGHVTATVRTRDFRAKWLEFGTLPHAITAKDRRGLAVGGLFFQSVQHPGARAKPHFVPAFDARAQEAILAVGNRIKARLATKEGLDTADVDIGLEEDA